ncbi:MAG TPA: extracellular solute-binding protein [Chloroflexi bacterium]|nr:extracellular solute-binding protein [Chloroflexota bacterium]
MPSINRNSPIPIYHQLKAIIKEQIESGVWRPGDCIPTEQELCQQYAISRSPVRQALKELVFEGLLFRRAGLGTFVEGCIAGEPATDTPIRMMNSDPHWSRVLDHASRAWNATHPNLRIQFEIESVSHNALYSTLSAAVGSGTAPDVAMVDGVWVAGLAQSGFLYPLQDQTAETQRKHGEFAQGLHPAFVEANSHAGKLYGLPAKSDTSLLWYRKDWFEREGLAPPRNWQALLDVARYFLQPALQARYDGPHPLIFPGGAVAGEATVYNLMPFVWSAGGEIFNTEGAVALDTPATRRALQFLQELIAVHHVVPPEVTGYDEHTTPHLFARGKAAMALGGSYESDVILDASGWDYEAFSRRVGYVAPPSAPDGHSVSTVGGTSYVVLRQCPSPTLVMDVLQLVTDPAVVGDMYRQTLQNLPSPAFDALLRPATDPLLTQTSRMIASGRARPSIPGYVKLSRQLQAMFEAAMSGDEPIGDITRRTSEFIGVIVELPCRSS